LATTAGFNVLHLAGLRNPRGPRTAGQRGTGGTYLNFLGIGDDGVRNAYDQERYARLAEIKRRWDPTNAFHLNQNVPPTG
jgi:hypothetical protein